MTSIKDRISQAIWTKNWSEDDLKKYIGEVTQCYFSYAADELIRDGAASGGSVTAILLYLLEHDQIDGALVCETRIVNDKVRPSYKIATNHNEILDAKGSKYTEVHFNRDALPMIKAFNGRLALVTLPCDAKNIASYRRNHREIDEKIKLVITLFCGHNSETALVDFIVEKQRKDHGKLIDFSYRSGDWRGEMRMVFEDGHTVIQPTSTYTNYQNLYYFAEAKCKYCIDHTGFFGDISAGDIWSHRMKDNPMKHTSLIARNDFSNGLIQRMIEEGALIGSPEPVSEVADGQARTLPAHFNLSARAKAGRFFNYKIKDVLNEDVQFFDWLIAFIWLSNEWFSRTRFGIWLLPWIPNQLIRAQLIFFKGLESL